MTFDEPHALVISDHVDPGQKLPLGNGIGIINRCTAVVIDHHDILARDGASASDLLG